MFGEGFDPLGDAYQLIKDRLAGRVAAENAEDLTGAGAPPLGVDEYGRPYLRGAPSAPAPAFDSRLVLIVAGVAAIALVVVLAKS